MAFLARPKEPSTEATMKVATLRASTSRRTEPSFLPALERLGERFDPGLEDDGDAAAEALVERRHLLREVVERTAQLDLVDQALVAELIGDDLEHHLDPGDRIAGVAGEWAGPARKGEPPDHLVDDGVGEIGLVGEVVIERTLGDARVGQDGVEAGALIAVAMDLLERGGDEALARRLGSADALVAGSRRGRAVGTSGHVAESSGEIVPLGR